MAVFASVANLSPPTHRDRRPAAGPTGAGLLVLVYATTVTAIIGLTRGSVDPGPPPTLLLLAGTPVPVPELLAAVLRQHLAEHRISRTLAGAPGPWLSLAPGPAGTCTGRPSS